jgi:hypothetical protein
MVSMTPDNSLDPKTGTRWADRPFLSIPFAAQLLGRSRAGIRAMLTDSRLRGVRVAGRTMVTTESVQALLDAAEPFQPGRKVIGVRPEVAP